MRKFALGTLIMTCGVAEILESDTTFEKFITQCVKRYCECDWGDLVKEDIDQNDNALKNGNARIFASYKYNPDDDLSIWVITESDRSVTTILFPHEY